MDRALSQRRRGRDDGSSRGLGETGVSKTFPGKVCRTADPSPALDDKKERVVVRGGLLLKGWTVA
jgi:hypothetical protein